MISIFLKKKKNQKAGIESNYIEYKWVLFLVLLYRFCRSKTALAHPALMEKTEGEKKEIKDKVEKRGVGRAFSLHNKTLTTD